MYAGHFNDAQQFGLMQQLGMGDYRYLISYFPCHWVVPVDFPNISQINSDAIRQHVI